MAMELGSTKWTLCLVSGLPTDTPLLCFGTVKNSPKFVWIGPKTSMCGVYEIV